MKMFSLRTLIDDILLLVRNNNISESEDLSRSQIASWIMAYKAYLTKKEQDKEEDDDDEDPDDSLTTTIGPLELIEDPDQDDRSDNTIYRTAEKINTAEDSEDDIYSIMGANGCVIQYMIQQRKHYHRFRRYTWNEPTCWYNNGYIYVEGDGAEDLGSIYVTGSMDSSETAEDEDSVTVPGWMIADIKNMIMKNELAFMLQRPSDDSNNSTLASIKPHGSQDAEK